MNIPDSVSGRKVTPRGVHLQPFGFSNYWMQDETRWLDLLTSMHMSWCLVLTESDNLRISGAAEALLGAGVIPIARFAYELPEHWTHGEEVGNLAELYARFNAPLVVQFSNEPFDLRSWRNNDVPPTDEAWAIIRDRWNEAAQAIVRAGGIAGFPDGPCYNRNPFEIIGDPNHYWQDRLAVYLGHHYGKGRPVNYPYDDVTQTGVALTWEQYLADLDDYQNDPAWNEGQPFLATMNQQRVDWARPGCTALDDDTCFLGYEKVRAWSRQTFGFEVPQALTEGGWVPRDRAGSGPVDVRWAMSTPRMVATKTLQMYEYPHGLFAVCPWLLADGYMVGGGDVGWPYDAWVTWAYQPPYGDEKPVVAMLQEHPPGPGRDVGDVLTLIGIDALRAQPWAGEIRGLCAEGLALLATR